MAFILSVLAALLLLAPACKPKPAAPTFGQLADEGATVFAQICARCHGEQGQGVVGPALMGLQANLGKFNTAQGLLAYIKVAMPMDQPGSLPDQDYRRTMAYILVREGLVQRDRPFDAGKLDQLLLQK